MAKHALKQVSVGAFNFDRFGGMVVLGWARIAATGERTRIAREDRRWFVLVAIVGFCGYVFGFQRRAFLNQRLLRIAPACARATLGRRLHLGARRKPPPATSLLALGLAAGSKW